MGRALSSEKPLKTWLTRACFSGESFPEVCMYVNRICFICREKTESTCLSLSTGSSGLLVSGKIPDNYFSDANNVFRVERDMHLFLINRERRKQRCRSFVTTLALSLRCGKMVETVTRGCQSRRLTRVRLNGHAKRLRLSMEMFLIYIFPPALVPSSPLLSSSTLNTTCVRDCPLAEQAS